jgi:hypothetical protein
LLGKRSAECGSKWKKEYLVGCHAFVCVDTTSAKELPKKLKICAEKIHSKKMHR